VRISCSTFPFQGLPLDQTLMRIRDLGFRYAELSAHHDPVWGHVQPAAVMSDPLLVLEMIETAEGRSGVKIGSLCLGLDHTALHERGQFEACAKLARRTRMPVLTVQVTKREELVEFRRLKDFLSIAADHGLTVCAETHSDSPLLDPDEAVRWALAVPGIGITLDTGHLLSSGKAQSGWTPLYPHVRHLHVKDAANGPDHYQMPVGKGSLDVIGLMQGLGKSGFAGFAVVEYVGPRRQDAMQFEPAPEVRALREALESALGSGPPPVPRA
jgi:sugar phosphate isomerase/epimerase